MEEKFTLLFQTQVNIGGDINVNIKVMSLPVVVIALLKMWGDDHTKNWCELIATGLTPDFSVIVTPSIMV